jgi:hypothetical protein
VLSKKVADLLRAFFESLYARLVAPCRLPAAEELDLEQAKINGLRVMLGALALWRTALVAFSSYYYYPANGLLACPQEFWLSLAALVLTACLTVGFLTPLATIGLLLMYNHVDLVLSITTLGSNLFTLCLFFLLFTSAGSRFSIDALNLANAGSPLHGLTRSCYSLIRFPTREQLRTYYWLLFMSYGITSLGAVSLHVHDEYWRKGQTVAMMMNNAFLCSLWQLSRSVSEKLPWLVSAFSMAACLGQVIFQLFMIPLVYTRWGVWFVGVWGTAFALISFVLLQISYIPSTECVLWALVFCPARVFAGLVRRAGKSSVAARIGWQPLSFSGAMAGGTLAAFLAVVIVTVGHHATSVKLFRKATKYIGPRLYYLGLDVPDVFNRLDLSTDKYWYVMERHHKDGTVSRVPIAQEDGSRQYYHWFDTVYFSNLLPWRRMMGCHYGDPRELLVPGKGCYELMRRLVRFDRKLNGFGLDTQYVVKVYGLADSRVNGPPRPVATLTLTDVPRVVHTGRVAN